MPRKRITHRRMAGQQQRAHWPWDDRGRSAVTVESVQRDMAAIRAMLPRRCWLLVRV